MTDLLTIETNETNGRVVTREAVPAGQRPKPHRIKSTGEVVHILKISPLTTWDINRAYPPPPTPKNKITHEDGTIEWEENPADPDYLRELAAHHQEVNMRIVQTVIELGVIVEMDERKIEKVRRYREVMKRNHNIELQESDEVLWVTRMAAPDPTELNALAQAIFNLAGPTEEVIQETARRF